MREKKEGGGEMGRGRRREERGEEGLVATSSSLFREKGRREKSILFLPLGQNGMKKRSLGRTDPPPNSLSLGVAVVGRLASAHVTSFFFFRLKKIPSPLLGDSHSHR